MGPEKAASDLNTDIVWKFLFTSTGVSIADAIKTAEQLQQEAQQAQQAAAAQEVISKGTGPAINAVAAQGAA